RIAAGRAAAARQGRDRRAGLALLDDAAEDLGRQGAARHLAHRLVVVVADPDAHDQLGREADEPGVAEGLAGAGLARHRAARIGALAGAPADDRLQHVHHAVHHGGRDEARQTLLLLAEEGRALDALDRLDAVGPDAVALVGEDGIG